MCMSRLNHKFLQVHLATESKVLTFAPAYRIKSVDIHTSRLNQKVWHAHQPTESKVFTKDLTDTLTVCDVQMTWT